jgi:FOG: GGDEF domain
VPEVRISASFGIAVTARSSYDLRQLLTDADSALYQAKHEGRNRVGVFNSVEAATIAG